MKDMPSLYRKLLLIMDLWRTGRMFVALSDAPGLDPFEHQLEARVVHFAARDLAPVGQEAAGFELLGPDAKAGAIPVQDLDL